MPPGYGEDVKTWPAASIHPPEPVKESPRVFKVDEIRIQTKIIIIIFLRANYPVC